ncbi:TPA: GTPase [Neisseria cinerea]
MHRYRISEIGQKVTVADFRPLDVLLVGATGVGKSPTLNALFGEQKAKVGTGVDPETPIC